MTTSMQLLHRNKMEHRPVRRSSTGHVSVLCPAATRQSVAALLAGRMAPVLLFGSALCRHQDRRLSSEGEDELPSEWLEAAGGGLLEVCEDDDGGGGCDTVEADGFDAGAEFEKDSGGGREECEIIYPAGTSKTQKRWLRSRRAQAAGSSV